MRTALAEAKSLEGSGYRTLIATSGAKAVEMARNADLEMDLALIGFDLARGMDAEETARGVLRSRSLPVLFILDALDPDILERVRGITRYGYILRRPDRFPFQPAVDTALELFHAHERMRLAEERLRTLIRTMPDPIWIKDTEGRYKSCNPAFERLVGMAEPDLVGKTDFEFFERKTAETFREHDLLALELNRQISNEEWVTFSGDSRSAFLEMTKIPIADGAGSRAGVISMGRDITERIRLEQSLEDREKRLRNLLETVANPEGDLGDLRLTEIIDFSTLNALLENFSELTGIAIAILDTQGTIHLATGWQDICTKFHRRSPKTAAFCTESDLYLATSVKEGEYVDYRCKNGLWDIVTPLYIESRHMGNIYTGQFFYDDDKVDEGYFLAQAEEHGFDREAYLEALRRVPRFTRAQVIRTMDFLIRLTGYVSRVSVGNLRQAIEKSKTSARKGFFRNSSRKRKPADS